MTNLEILLSALAAPGAVFLCAVVAGGIGCRDRWRDYLVNLLIVFDQGINTLCGGAPDETMSSACYRFGARLPPKSRAWRLAYRGVNCLFFWQPDHCRKAYTSERDRKRMPPSCGRGMNNGPSDCGTRH